MNKKLLKKLFVLTLIVMMFACVNQTTYSATIDYDGSTDTSTNSRKVITVTYSRSEFKALKGTSSSMTVKFSDGEKATVNLKYYSNKVTVTVKAVDYTNTTTTNWTVKCNKSDTLKLTGTKSDNVNVGYIGKVTLKFDFNHPVAPVK